MLNKMLLNSLGQWQFRRILPTQLKRVIQFNKPSKFSNLSRASPTVVVVVVVDALVVVDDFLQLVVFVTLEVVQQTSLDEDSLHTREVAETQEARLAIIAPHVGAWATGPLSVQKRNLLSTVMYHQ
jgi:hypothetical protein